MLSLTGAFRAGARRQTCAACAGTTRFMSHNPSPIRDLRDMINDTATYEASRDDLNAGQDGIVDSPQAPGATLQGSPILRGFQDHQFLQPKDFSRAEYNKPRPFLKKPTLGPDARESRYLDPLHQLGIDPLRECLNSSLLSRFVTNMGKIKKRSQTNLTWRNQRRMGKAIRRAKMMGIIPVLSRRHLLNSTDP